MSQMQDNNQPFVPARTTEVMHEVNMPVVIHHHDGEVGPQGPQGEHGHMGPQGPQGPIGAAGRKVTVASSTSPQTIEHNFNEYPKVTMIDAEGKQVIGQVSFPDLNHVTVSWNGNFTGTIQVEE